MTWEKILKSRGHLTAAHFKHLKNAVHDAFVAHGDAFLRNPKGYKDEIVHQAAVTYTAEMGTEDLVQQTKLKFANKFPHVINRIVNNMRNKSEDVEKLSIFPKKKKPKPINRKKDKPKPRGPFTDRD